MPPLAQVLADRFIGQQVNVLRLSVSEQARTFRMLGQLQSRLLVKMNQQIPEPGFGSFTQQRLGALYRLTDQIIQQQYTQISTSHNQTLVEVSRLQGQQARTIINAVIGVPLLSVGVPLNSLKALIRDDLVDGRPATYWWAQQTETLKTEFRDVIRQGAFAGETLGQMKQRVQGTRAQNYQDGIMARVGRRAETLIRTSLLSVANAARHETFQANTDVLDGQQWLSTLDDRTCWSVETLILMADGTQKPAGEIVVGDMVLGGVTGVPCRVSYAGKRTVLSSVAIQYNGRAIGSVTHDHEVLTPTGWQEIGDLCLLPDLSEREVLCRRVVSTNTQNSSTRDTQGRSRQCVEKTWGTSTHNLGDDAVLCRGLCLGADLHRANEDGMPARIQYDGWRRRHSRAIESIADAPREEVFATVSGGSGLSSQDASSLQEVRTEGSRDETKTLCDSGRPGHIEKEVQFTMVGESNGSESATTVSGNSHTTKFEYQSALEGQGIQGHNQQTARCRTSHIESEQSRLGAYKNNEGISVHESKMARSCLSQEDEAAPISRRFIRCETCGQEEMVGIIDTRTAGSYCGEDEIAVGQMAGVTSGRISGTAQDGPLVVVTLSIEGDPTYVAGGIIVHNCPICAALDGEAWSFDGEALDETTQQFPGPPPQHFNCRCTLVPRLKTWAQLQKDAGADPALGEKLDTIEKDLPKGKRESMGGPVPADQTYDSWLKAQSEDVQRDILGPQRLALWQDGTIDVQDLVDQQNRPLTLEQIRARAAIEEHAVAPSLNDPISPELTSAPSTQWDEAIGTKNIHTVEQNEHSATNGSYIVKFEDGSQAVWKPSIEESPNLRQGITAGTYYKREVAAYEISKIIGMTDLVPPTVLRDIDGSIGSLQAWETNAKSANTFENIADKYGKSQVDIQRASLFDAIMGNTDRHSGNWLVTREGKLVLIDHGLILPNIARHLTIDIADGIDSTIDAIIPDAIKQPWKDNWPRIKIAMAEHGIRQAAIDLAEARYHYFMKPNSRWRYVEQKIDNS
jgi:hypothetical protein